MKKEVGAQKALALRFWPELPAPILTAKAKGRLAERLIHIAQSEGIHIVEDQILSEVLFPLDLGDFVPEACYTALAKIFAHIKKMEELK